MSMNKKKFTYTIAIYCSSEAFGGLEMNVVKLARWMSDDGFDVYVFMPEGSPVYTYAVKQQLRVRSIDVNRKYFDFRRAKSTAAVLRQMSIDMLVVSATRDVDFGSIVKRFYQPKLNLVYLSQMQIGVNKRGLLHSFRYKMYDRWIVPLPYLKDEVGKLTHYSTSKVEVVPLCIDTAYYAGYVQTKLDARAQLNLPDNALLIGVLGRIDPQKKQDVLVRAAYRLKQEGISVHLLIVGEPTRNDPSNYALKLNNLIGELQMAHEVHIRPFMDDTRAFYRAIDIFAMPTTGETFGMVTVEAMVSGVPVVASRSGGSIELLDNGNMGVLYEPDDIESLVTGIRQLLNKHDLSAQLADKIRQDAISKYDKKVVLTAFREIIKQLHS